jgi:hypothetical protein
MPALPLRLPGDYPIVTACFAVIARSERDEAIQFRCCRLDCFASLAMTAAASVLLQQDLMCL